jgi:hypothetical protein
MNVYYSFRATMSVDGRPVNIISSGRIGTRRHQLDAVEFDFSCAFDKITIAVGSGADKRYLGTDEKGYLCLKDEPDQFALKDDRHKWLGTGNLPQGKLIVSMFTVEQHAVIQFEGAEAYEDVDVVNNPLIVARESKQEYISGEVRYFIPDGQGSWVEYSSSKYYEIEPVMIELNVN